MSDLYWFNTQLHDTYLLQYIPWNMHAVLLCFIFYGRIMYHYQINISQYSWVPLCHGHFFFKHTINSLI